MGTALITGASSGLGVEFAKLFAADGHNLILVARRKDLLDTLANELRQKHTGLTVHVVPQDLGLPGAGQALFDQVKGLPVDFLVNNAGFGTSGAFKKQRIERELQMIDLNVRTLVELSALFLPQMLERKFGRILNVGSVAGFQPGPFMSTYYASKAFVNSFSEGLHEELKGTGVSCTVLAPGATATEFSSSGGIKNTRLFRSGMLATSAEVARTGYRAMKAGRSVQVAGFTNKLMVQTLRLSPRFLIRKIAAFVNREA